MAKPLTAELVRETFRLDVLTGHLYRRKAASGVPAHSLDKPAGCARPTDGRWMVNCHGRLYLRARLVFLYLNGWLPKVVEHRDRDPRNDRPSNLRPADHSDNGANTSRKSTNKCGVKGVHLCRRTGKYRVQIGGKSAGRFRSLDEAAIAADQLGRSIYGDFWHKGD